MMPLNVKRLLVVCEEKEKERHPCLKRIIRLRLGLELGYLTLLVHDFIFIFISFAEKNMMLSI